jgi:diaminopimelate decarboxylase
VSVLPDYLLPDSATVDARGHLFIGGCDVTLLAEEYGTPLFVYDEAHLRARCREAVAAFGDGVAYATKAFLCKAMARLAHEEGMFLDVASGGELHVARAAGVPADRLILHGNNKSERELELALEEGLSRIVIDSFDELSRIETLVAGGLTAPSVMIRITPGVEAHTHEFVKTGQEDSKFGLSVASGAAEDIIEKASRSPHVNLVGLHVHIGSQIFTTESFAKAIDVIAPLLARVQLPELCLGGGLGIPYVSGESAPSISEWANTVRRACKRAGIDAKISAEPGRSIVGVAAITIYRVGTIKDVAGIRTYVAVDGGMSDNPRPVLYGSGYETFLPRAANAERTRTIRLVGKHCESGDMLVAEGLVPEDLQLDDLIATPVTGAYGHSMGSNYNKIPRPAVVFAQDGQARLAVRRETYEDLLRCDF